MVVASLFVGVNRVYFAIKRVQKDVKGIVVLNGVIFGLLVGAGFGKRLRWLTEKHPISIYPHLPTESW